MTAVLVAWWAALTFGVACGIYDCARNIAGTKEIEISDPFVTVRERLGPFLITERRFRFSDITAVSYVATADRRGIRLDTEGRTYELAGFSDPSVAKRLVALLQHELRARAM